MGKTFKDRNDLDFMAPHARAAHLRALRDPSYASHVGFYLPEQEPQETVDITAAYAQRVLDGRA
jgi:hypothetical protein